MMKEGTTEMTMITTKMMIMMMAKRRGMRRIYFIVVDNYLSIKRGMTMTAQRQ